MIASCPLRVPASGVSITASGGIHGLQRFPVAIHDALRDSVH